MGIILTRDISPELRIRIIANELQEYYGEIVINGNLWDYREFPDYASAMQWALDPLADDRARDKHERVNAARREAESISAYASDYCRIETGRRVGAKPHC